MVTGLEGLEHEIREMNNVFFHDSSVLHRTKGVGIVPEKEAFEFGAVGPTGRGSGIAQDARMLGYAAYDRINFKPVVETGGDCYARCVVRGKELHTSIDIIKQAVDKIPDGPIEVKVTGSPDGEYWARAEQPRGEVIHYVKGNGTRHLLRHRVRTPTFANLPFLVKALKGCELADVPVIVLSIDPCIGCMER
jgi:Ni,Fe-hydrogenase III large subunit